MKKLYGTLLLCCSLQMMAQNRLSGQVITEENSLPLKGAVITTTKTKTAVLTDQNGLFDFQTLEKTITLTVSHSGYETQTFELSLPLKSPLKIVMTYKVKEIQEVNLSTGYQKIPKERATGSFTLANEKLLNQQVSTNILDRLPNVASGMILERGSSGTPKLMVRGLSTIKGPTAPLIVVDDFPYEGDISNINPNMVESITVLKDAAAASIWGARAANGVIVITTKTGKFKQPIKMEFTINTSYSPKPDLGYLKTISSADFIEVERELFNRGFYNSDINSSSHPVLSPVVNLLNKARNGLISSEEANFQLDQLKNINAKEQFSRYMYMPSEKRQYYLGLTGGAPDFSWTSSFVTNASQCQMILCLPLNYRLII